MCLDAKAMRSYAAAKGWETRRRRASHIPFEEGGSSYRVAAGDDPKALQNVPRTEVPEYKKRFG